MVDTVSVSNKVKRVMDELYRFIQINKVAIYVYRGYDFPLMQKVSDVLIDGFTTFEKRKAKNVAYLKSHKSSDKLIVLTILLNDNSVNDIYYQYDTLNNLSKTTLLQNVEFFQIMLNCDYKSYHEYMQCVCNEIAEYIKNKNSNRVKSEIDGIGIKYPIQNQTDEKTENEGMECE